MSKATQIAADAIQRTYNDATQTALDHQAARSVITDLRRAGWMSPQEVAAIVEAAGGRVTLTWDHQDAMQRESYELITGDDHAAGPGAIFVASRRCR